MPGYDDLVARLTATLPPEGETTLVHGDFRLDNVLVRLSPRPRISAVVDWEMATLGDPLADFKLAVVLEGIYARYLQHQTVGEGFEQEGLVVPTLVARAHQVLDSDD